MKKVILCGSVRFRDQIASTMEALRAIGLEPLFPNLNPEAGNRDQAIDTAHKHRLALEHFQAADEADAAYFLLPGGYIGNSLKIELGYVVARDLPIYFSESTGDADLDAYASAIISVENLKELL